jgi:hypothetical protein
MRWSLLQRLLLDGVDALFFSRLMFLMENQYHLDSSNGAVAYQRPVEAASWTLLDKSLRSKVNNTAMD